MELEMHQIAFLTNLNPWEIGAIVFVVLLLFGAKKLPELARGAGKAIKEFKKVSTEAEETFKTALSEEEEKQARESAAGQAEKKSS